MIPGCGETAADHFSNLIIRRWPTMAKPFQLTFFSSEAKAWNRMMIWPFP
jgi:hypothetical protein